MRADKVQDEGGIGKRHGMGEYAQRQRRRKDSSERSWSPLSIATGDGVVHGRPARYGLRKSANEESTVGVSRQRAHARYCLVSLMRRASSICGSGFSPNGVGIDKPVGALLRGPPDADGRREEGREALSSRAESSLCMAEGFSEQRCNARKKYGGHKAKLKRTWAYCRMFLTLETLAAREPFLSVRVPIRMSDSQRQPRSVQACSSVRQRRPSSSCKRRERVCRTGCDPRL